MNDCLYINFAAVADGVALCFVAVQSSSVAPQPLDDGHEVIV